MDASRAEAREWLQAIYQANFAYVWNSLRRLGVADSDRDDLAHEVFVIVFKKKDELDPARPIKPWLFGISFRVAAGHRRLARHGRELGGDLERHAGGDEAAAAERRELVVRALAVLDLDQRAVVILHDIDGASAPEIATALDVKLNTVYSRLRLGREKLAAALRRFDAEAA